MSTEKVGIIQAAMRNKNIILLITVVLMLIGVVALLKMPRNEFPQFTIRQGVVVGVYPGATSAEVEAQLTREVENYIFSYQEVKKAKTYSQSKEGMMYIFVELNDNVKNADQFWSKLKHGLSELKMTLPTGVVALIANSDFGDTSAMLITLSSDTKSYKDLEEQLKKLEAECRKIPATSKIKHFGLQKEKIFVNVKPEKLNEYNIKTISLLGSYQSNGMINSAGVLKDGKTNLAVHLPANFESEKDLVNQIVYSDPRGNVVRLKDIASIERRYDDPDSYIKQNGKKTILLSLEMQPGNNIVEFGKDVEKALATFQKQCPKDIQVAKISELPKYVDDSVSNFMEEFLIAIVAVILVTLILLPFRVALVAAITIPIAVLITLGCLYFLGVELNTVSLAALILVLGMIVDNSIVVIDNHVEKIDHGFSVWHAAIKSAKELVAPIVVATLAIFAAFWPLGFMVPGSAGEFMQPMPIVVGVALLSSIAVALLLVPYLNYVFIKKGLKKAEGKKSNKSMLDRLQAIFDAALEKAFRYPKTVLTITVATIVLAIILFKSLNQELFPEMERNQFAVEVYLPTGASIESTAKIVDSLENVLIKDKRVTNVTSFIGTSSPRFHTVYAPHMPSPNYGQLLVNTISDKATRAVVNEYNVKYSNNFPNAHVKWKILAMQFQPSIEIRISSDSIKDIRKVQSQVDSMIKRTKGIAWARNDWNEKLQNINVTIDRDRANILGYQKGFVGTSLMVGLDGIPLTTIWENDYPVEVRLTQDNGAVKDINSIQNQYITSMSSFKAMPLRSFATCSPQWTEGTIVRRNGTRTMTIQIDNVPGFISNNIFEELRPQIDALKLPEGTSINYGGDLEASFESLVPMAIALLLSIVLIFFIILFQFKKIKLSLLIMSTMLLVLPGVAIGLTVTGYAFSITAFIGIISLCGMVVRNGIILIDYARELHEKEKLTVRAAALAAGKRRMRPIFLTAAAAAVGVIPMIASRSPLWGPLGTVICFGLLISMVLTLFALPVLYSFAYSDKKNKKSKWAIPTSAMMVILMISFSAISTNTKAQTYSLDSCKNLALKNNFKIKEAVSDVAESEQVKKNAFTNYFPKVNASATAIKFNDYLIKGNIPQMNLPVYDGNMANLSAATQFTYFPGMEIKAINNAKVANIMAMQPVFAGGRIYNGNRLASVGIEINKDKQAMTTTDVIVRTEELFWTVLSLEEKLKTLDNYIQLLDTLQRDVNNALKAGLIQRNDLLKVQLKRNDLLVSRFKLTNGLTLSKHALCQQIGIPFDSTTRFTNIQTIEETSNLVLSNPSEAVTSRNEYKLLQKVVTVQELQKKMDVGECLPQLTVGAVGIYSDVMDTKTKNAMLLATISLPISDWWGGSHKIKEGNIKIQAAQNKLTETSELLILQITQVQNELNEQLYQINIDHQSVEQARENLKVTEDNYKAGVVGMSDLLEAQSTFQNALNSLTEAQYNYQIKRAKYLQTINNYK